jgi:hypothetical protein
MMTMRRLIRVPWALCLAVGLLLGVGAGSSWQAGAAGNTLFIAANGTGTTCSTASPCSLDTALALAKTGDTVEVVEGSGSFGTPAAPELSAVTVPAGVTLAGHSPAEAGQFFFETATAAIGLEGGAAAGAIRNAEVENLGSGNAIAAAAPGSGTTTIERVVATGSGGGAGCAVDGEAVIVNTVCSGPTGAELTGAAGVPTTQRLVNVTVVGSGDGAEVRAGAGGSLVAQISNSIIRGAGEDVSATAADGSTEVALDHSNFASVEAQAGATVSAPGSATNQIAAPLFANAAAGDFSEQVASPTVDAGAVAPESGSLDVAGNDRVLPGQLRCRESIPAAIDIGAYELVPVAPPCVPPITEAEPAPEETLPQMVRIPRLVGLTSKTAVTRLRHLHLRIRLRSVARTCHAEAKVVRAQKPSAGKLVPRGTTARLRLGCSRLRH